MTNRSPRARRRRPQGGMLIASGFLLAACAVPSADYADAACAEISTLLESESRSHAKVENFLLRAAARADRAADTDSSFTDLYADLVEVRDAGRAGDDLDGASEQEANQALADVMTACADMGTPIRAEEGVLSELTLRELASP